MDDSEDVSLQPTPSDCANSSESAPAPECVTLEEKRRAFGVRLRTLRTSLEQSERDIIHLTRISPPFISALEEGRFDALPGEVFGRGFIKNICKVLETDPAPLLKEYNACWEHAQTKMKSARRPRGFFQHHYRPDHRSRNTRPLLNYFSGRGFFLWIACPLLLTAAAFLLMYLRTMPQENLAKKSENTIRSSDSGKSTPKGDSLGEAPVMTAPSDKSSVSKQEAHDDSSVHQITNEQSQNPRLSMGTLSEGVSEHPTEEATQLRVLHQGDSSADLRIQVLEPVIIKVVVDGELREEKSWEPGDHIIRFNKKADLFVETPSKIKVFFNGQPLTGEAQLLPEKHLSFHAGSDSKVKL
ncbi:MAG: helix-turn-helix domain-containing protein [Deltaproteobacteria bacterium]|nr:helix-turn-helix domain-containing protein [Deltaproteobacteria bacterium]